MKVEIFLDQELITYRYSSCCCCYLGDALQKKAQSSIISNRRTLHKQQRPSAAR